VYTSKPLYLGSTLRIRILAPLQNHSISDWIIVFDPLMLLHCRTAASNLFQSVMETLKHEKLGILSKLEHVQAMILGILVESQCLEE
jgi:hypothetical protein